MALKDYRDMQKRCSSCSYCKWIPFDKVKSARFAENCPASSYFKFNAYSARGRFQMGLAIVNGELDCSGKTEEIIYNCLSCGACDVSCKICRYNLEPLEHNIELKATAAEAGQIPPSGQNMLDSLKAEATMLSGRNKADRTAWARELGLLDARTEKVEGIFFPGCRFSYEKPEAARNRAKLLLDLGVRLGYLFEADGCCGGRAYQMGAKDAFNKSSAANLAVLQNCDAEYIVTPCADCYYALKRLYAARGLKIKVYHITELLEKLYDEGRLQFRREIPVTVTYHDPCHLGRLGEEYIPWEGKEKKILNQVHTWEPKRPRYNGAHGVYDSPRKLIEAIPGIRLVEMERIREYSWCCGAGGGCGELSPDFSEWTANERQAEAKATGANMIITACPWCESNLRKAADGLEVCDIVDLILRAI